MIIANNNRCEKCPRVRRCSAEAVRTSAPVGSGRDRRDGGSTVAPPNSVHATVASDDQLAVTDLALQAGQDAGLGRSSLSRRERVRQSVEGQTLGQQLVVVALHQGVNDATGALGGTLEVGAHAATSPWPLVLKLCRASSSSALSAWRPLCVVCRRRILLATRSLRFLPRPAMIHPLSRGLHMYIQAQCLTCD